MMILVAASGWMHPCLLLRVAFPCCFVGRGRAWSRAGRKKKKPEEGDSSSGLSEGVRLGEAAFSLLLQSKSRKVGDPYLLEPIIGEYLLMGVLTRLYGIKWRVGGRNAVNGLIRAPFARVYVPLTRMGGSFRYDTRCQKDCERIVYG